MSSTLCPSMSGMGRLPAKASHNGTTAGYTEGFDTLDLKDAKSLLEQLRT